LSSSIWSRTNRSVIQIHSPRPPLDRSHIGLHRNCFALFDAQNLS
jgi:hypothetical protein